MFVKKLAAGITLGLGLAATSAAFAADQADITVTGFITPVACDINLTNANVHVSASVENLADDVLTPRPLHNVGVEVACGGAGTQFSLSATDHKPGTAYTQAPGNFGLGETDADEKIGYYNMRFAGNTLTADSNTVVGLGSADNQTFVTAPTEPEEGLLAGPALQNNAYLGFTQAGTTVANIIAFNGSLQVLPFLAPKNELTVSDRVEIDAGATITVNYL